MKHNDILLKVQWIHRAGKTWVSGNVKEISWGGDSEIRFVCFWEEK